MLIYEEWKFIANFLVTASAISKIIVFTASYRLSFEGFRRQLPYVVDKHLRGA